MQKFIIDTYSILLYLAAHQRVNKEVALLRKLLLMARSPMELKIRGSLA